ncbi:MAG: DUF3291 domain-containing protein, partial [Myxococcaceae bacterium]|nr:DUF3291 domain-containing protein [Myxococcaceae bacterium]
GKPYAISSTYLRQPSGEAAEKKFSQLMAPISMQLTNQKGLVAMQLTFSEHCHTARTLTVWEDEAAMYSFVMSKAHVDAMAAVGELSRGGSIALHWSGSDRDATWSTATQKLGAHSGAQY